MRSLDHLFLLLVAKCLLISVCVSKVQSKDRQLGEYIKDFTPLFYDAVEVGQRHLITKRSIYDKVIDVALNFHEKKLDLSLYPTDNEVFYPEAKISVDGVLSVFDKSHLYKGHVKGDAGSFVSGSVIGGVFQGVITTGSTEVYHVDRKAYHPPHPLTNNDKVHSIIYKEEDVDIDKFHEKQRAKRSTHLEGFCGRRIPKLAHDMDEIENSGITEQADDGRKKRATTPTKNTCNLFMQSDPELWAHIKSTLGSSDDTMIKQEISALFNFLVTEVNGIYKTQEFDGKEGYEFRVDRLAINSTCSSSNDHVFCDKNVDVANFLNLNTYTNHDDYCLAYVLTYRDFADGTLGLAWVAKAGSTVGGICSKYKPYSEAGSTRKKSLNTGIVTVKNYGERVPKLMSKLTLAHEIGHNFGSEHDVSGSTLDCTPYKDQDDEKGNYIMYYAAITGKRDNNILFSKCSKNSISAVLSNSKNTACFIAPTDGHCGNQIKEGTEDCDCGYTADCVGCCKCCVGRTSSNEAAACKLKTGPGVSCDPSQGPCCAGDCSFHSRSTMCKPATECSLQAVCDGTRFQCPTPTPRNNGTVCNSLTQVCENGECTGSICSKIAGGRWEECSLSFEDKGVSKASLCSVSCKDPVSQKCHSSYDTSSLPTDFKDMLTNVNRGDIISLKPGSPCDKDLGFCDYFDTCRRIDDLGPLARLKNLLLSFTSIEKLRDWLKVYWWVVLLSLIGLVGFMVLLVKFGAVFTSSSNPDKDKALKITKPFSKSKDAHRRAAGPSVGYRQRDAIEMT